MVDGPRATFDPSILKRPRWILAIIVGLAVAMLFVRLGSWQLSRLEERRASNARIEERMDEPPRSLEELIGVYGSDADALIYRQATVQGRYRLGDEFFSIGRNYDGVTGTMVVTPLELDDGSVMIVVRGLAPVGTPGPPAATFEPPTGTVTLTGRLDDGEEPLRLGEPDPDNGVLRSISRIDLAYIDRWLKGDVRSISLVMTNQSPANEGATLLSIPPPELSEGRHLGYAVQWFAFAIIAAVGTAVLVRQAGMRASTDENDPEQVPHQ